MKVSVVTQTYNAEKTIERCVESVLNQTYTDFEYIIIDNGCNDGTSSIIQEYVAKDSRIKLVRFEKNMYGPRWFDVFVEYGIGDYFTDLDSDDWLEPDYLKRLLNVAEERAAA